MLTRAQADMYRQNYKQLVMLNNGYENTAIYLKQVLVHYRPSDLRGAIVPVKSRQRAR
jgi:hypothetical protein